MKLPTMKLEMEKRTPVFAACKQFAWIPYTPSSTDSEYKL